MQDDLRLMRAAVLTICMLAPGCPAVDSADPSATVAPDAILQVVGEVGFQNGIDWRWDCGTVEEGDPIKCALTVRNVSTSTIPIEGVVKSCGCTTATISRNTIGVDETADIVISIETWGRVGNFQTSASVIGGPHHDVLFTLRITALILKPSSLVALPERIDFGIVDRLDTPFRDCIIQARRSLGRERTTLRIPESGTAGTVVDVLPDARVMQADDGLVETSTMRITLPRDKPVGRFADYLQVKSTNLEGREMTATIAVVATIVDCLDLDSNSLFFDQLELNASQTKRLTYTCSPGCLTSFVAAAESEWCQVNYSECNEETTTGWVDITVRPQSSGLFRTVLRLTSSAVNRAIPITVYAQSSR